MALTPPSAAARSHVEPAEPQPDWARLRREFPTTERFVYLDIANKAILPRTVEAAAHEWLADVYQAAGARAFAMEEIERTREAVADTFGAPARNVALIKNTSEGVNIVAEGLGIEPGDNVVIGDSEHEANTFPWLHARRRGLEVRRAMPDQSGCMTLKSYEDVVDRRTRAISAAWVAYGNGQRRDMPALAEFCRTRGILLIADGIQAVGVLATPLAELGADVVIAGGHKAQLSVAGAGLMYVRDEIIERLTPPYASKFSFTSNDRRQPDPVLALDAHRFEYGNPNFLGTWIQARSAGWLKEIGLENIEARVRALTTRLIELADAAGWRVATPRPWAERAGIVSLDLPVDPEAFALELRRRRVMVSAKDGYIRAAIHFYNNDGDLDRLVEEIRDLLREVRP